jgi:sn-glycerol 3-phosphate transport system permease protein
MEKRASFTNLWLAGALVAPQLLLVFLFFYWPATQAVWWAFTTQPPFGGSNEWVGLDNFKAIFEDRIYWDSVIVSFVFAAMSTSLAVGLALLFALFVDRRLTGYRVYRFVYFWPYAVAAPAAGLAFRFIFAPEAGLVAAINQWYPGLWNPALKGFDALVLIVLANAWKMVAYNFIFFLAALQAIPRTLIEAAAMDGANVIRRALNIQCPLLAPTFFFLLVINITESFVDSFGIVDITTNGGPARATQLMVFKIYSDGFKGLDYSMAAAQSIVLMAVVIALTFVQFRYIERRIHYR